VFHAVNNDYSAFLDHSLLHCVDVHLCLKKCIRTYLL
jgi:hypothetical protein